jgi:hypothetical protein
MPAAQDRDTQQIHAMVPSRVSTGVTPPGDFHWQYHAAFRDVLFQS